MKNKLFLLAITSLVILQACTKPWPQDLEGKKAKLQELSTEKDKIEKDIAQLEMEIAALDTGSAALVKSIPVRIDTIGTSTFKHFVKVQGKIDSKGNVMVSPKMSGVVTNVMVQEGSKVGKGQLLATLDASVLNSSIAELKTALDLANIAFDKQKRLWDQKIGTEMQYLQAKNQKESLEARMATTREQLEMTKIYAPISGTVDKVNIKVGEAAMPGFGAFQIVNSADIHFASELSESYVGKIHQGDEVQISFPTLGEEFTSKVTVVGQSIHPVNRTVAIEASLPKNNPDLKPNMSGEIVVNDKTIPDALTISLNLLMNTELGTFVYVAEEGDNGKWVARKKLIQTGMSYNGKTVVTSGLKKGDLLITVGYQDLSEGQPISF